MTAKENISTERSGNYAGFWMRVSAFFIDSIVLIVINSIVAFSFKLEVRNIFLNLGALSLFNHPLFLITGWLYYAFMESSDKQATVGKLAFGLKVTDDLYNPIGFGKATGRFFGKILSYVILFGGFIMAAFTKRKQGLHDKMAGCLILKADNSQTVS